MTNGTLRQEARDFTRRVLPEPLGPISRMFDFSIHIVQVRVGDDRIRSAPFPAIHETLEVVADAQGEPPLGNVLPNHVLVEMGDQGLGSGD
jgi:hypothetical protein